MIIIVKKTHRCIVFKTFVKSDHNNNMIINELEKMCIVYRMENGIFAYNYLGLMLIKNIENLLRLHQDKLGSEIYLPTIISTNIFAQSKRTQKFNDEMFNIKTKKHEFSLSCTGEELALISTIKQNFNLPTYIYQISKKFRNEIRPKNFLIRTREFIMKDGYYFSKKLSDVYDFYYKITQNYIEFFNSLNLKPYICQSDASSMNGKFSHEFIVESTISESKFFVSESGALANKIMFKENSIESIKNNIHNINIINSDFTHLVTSDHHVKNGVEIGHIFFLGKHYSESFQLKNDIHMGSFGIGISRLLVVIAEECINRAILNKKRFTWPECITHFHSVIICRNEHEIIYFQSIFSMRNNNICNKKIQILLDDEINKSFELRLQNAILLGIPIIVYSEKNNENECIFDVCGNNYQVNKLHIYNKLISFF